MYREIYKVDGSEIAMDEKNRCLKMIKQSKRKGINNRHAIIYEVPFFHKLLFIYYFKLHPISVKTHLVVLILL